MYFGLSNEELIIIGLVAFVILWALWRILSGYRHDSKFFYWIILIVSGASLWLWYSGNGALVYKWAKGVIGTP